MTYAECMEKIKAIGSGLAGIGIGPRDSFGIYAANSMQWAWAGLGGWKVGATLVPVYDTLGDNVVMYEVNHADMKMIFVEKKKLGGVLSVLKDCPTLKYAWLRAGGCLRAPPRSSTHATNPHTEIDLDARPSRFVPPRACNAQAHCPD